MTKKAKKEQQEKDLSKEIIFAKPEDITQLIAMAYKTFDENELEGTGNDRDFDKITLSLTDWVIKDAVLVKRNEDNDKFIDGFIALRTSTTWWSEDPVLYTGIFYIKPEKRSFKLAKALLMAAKEYAIMNDIPLVIDIIDNKDVQRKTKLLEYLGFKRLGTLYTFNPLTPQ